MNQEEFIAKLQMVYVGDRNAFNEIVKEHEDLVSYACDLEDEICNLKGENQRLKEEMKIKDGINETTFKNLMEERKENQRLNNVLKEILEIIEKEYK